MLNGFIALCERPSDRRFKVRQDGRERFGRAWWRQADWSSSSGSSPPSAMDRHVRRVRFTGSNGLGYRGGQDYHHQDAVRLAQASGGEGYLNGKQFPDRRIDVEIGSTPQRPPSTWGSVSSVIAFFGDIFGLSKGEIEKREGALLDFIDLAAWKNELVANLSGGMKHRVSLACALLHEPPLLLLDEPTVGVDPELRVSFWDYFNEIKSKGRTILITTHYMDEANRCDRIGFMRSGRLIAEGRPEELLSLTATDNLEDAFMAFSERAAGEEKP